MWPFLKPFHALFRQIFHGRGAATPAVPPAALAHNRPAAQTPLPQQHVADVVQQVLCYQQIQAHEYTSSLADKHKNRLIDETLVILKTVSLPPKIKDALQGFINQELGISPFTHKDACPVKAQTADSHAKASSVKPAVNDKEINVLKGKIFFYNTFKSKEIISGGDLNKSRLGIIDEIIALKKNYALSVDLDKELGTFLVREFDGCSLARASDAHKLRSAPPHAQHQAEPAAAPPKKWQKPDIDISELVKKVSKFDLQMRTAARNSYEAYSGQISELVNQCAMALQSPSLQGTHRETLAGFIQDTFGSYNLIAAYGR